MAFCKNCGIKLEEGVKFCPDCGTRVGDYPIPNRSNPNHKEAYSIGAKIALGVAGFIAFTGVWGGIADGMWIVAALSFCALGAIIAVFTGTIEKKYAWHTAICTFFVVTLAIGLSADDEMDGRQSQTEQKKETESMKQEQKKNVSNNQKSELKKEINDMSAFVGEYTYSYYLDNTNAQLYFKLSLNSDGSFVFGGANETTKNQITLDKVMSGYDYPEGGKWKVKDTSVGKAAFLEFDCDWGEGSITPDKRVIQIKNMNGRTLKAPLIKNN